MSRVASVVLLFLASWHVAAAQDLKGEENAHQLIPRQSNIFADPLSIPNPQVVSFAPVAAPSYPASAPAPVSSAGGQYYSSAGGQYHSSSYASSSQNGGYPASSQPRYSSMPSSSAAASPVPASHGHSGGRRPVNQQQASGSRSSSSAGSTPTNAGSLITPMGGIFGAAVAGLVAVLVV